MTAWIQRQAEAEKTADEKIGEKTAVGECGDEKTIGKVEVNR